MKGWLQGWVISVGCSLVLLPQAALAQARDLAEARALVVGSGEQSIRALNRALGLVADPETRAAIERAKGEVFATQKRAFQDLDRAERGDLPVAQGLTTAIDATGKHLQVLEDLLNGVRGKVPAQAEDAIRHAMEVSAHGNAVVRARQEGKQGQDLPRPAFSPPPGQEERPSPPAGPRDFGGRGGFGPPGGPRPGR